MTIEEQFRNIDVDGDGSIGIEELRAILPETMGMEEAAALLKEFDADGNGALELDELRTMIETLQERARGLSEARDGIGNASMERDGASSHKRCNHCIRGLLGLSVALDLVHSEESDPFSSGNGSHSGGSRSSSSASTQGTGTVPIMAFLASSSVVRAVALSSKRDHDAVEGRASPRPSSLKFSEGTQGASFMHALKRHHTVARNINGVDRSRSPSPALQRRVSAPVPVSGSTPAPEAMRPHSMTTLMFDAAVKTAATANDATNTVAAAPAAASARDPWSPSAFGAPAAGTPVPPAAAASTTTTAVARDTARGAAESEGEEEKEGGSGVRVDVMAPRAGDTAREVELPDVLSPMHGGGAVEHSAERTMSHRTSRIVKCKLWCRDVYSNGTPLRLWLLRHSLPIILYAGFVFASAGMWTALGKYHDANAYEGHASGEYWSYLDSVYFVCITITTVGFGDLSPSDETGRIICIVWGSFGLVVATVAIRQVNEMLVDFLSPPAEWLHEKMRDLANKVKARARKKSIRRFANFIAPRANLLILIALLALAMVTWLFGGIVLRILDPSTPRQYYLMVRLSSLTCCGYLLMVHPLASFALLPPHLCTLPPLSPPLPPLSRPGDVLDGDWIWRPCRTQ